MSRYLEGDVGRVGGGGGEGDGGWVIRVGVGGIDVAWGSKCSLVDITLGLGVTCAHDSHMTVTW